MTLLSLDNIPALQDEVRALAAERGAVILAHNYQLPEIQQVADYVGDSLGLSQRAAASDADAIAFCGVHFMAETASILCPEKTVLLPDPDAGCSLADSITAPQLRAWKAKHPGAVVVMYVNTSAEVKAETDYCVTSSNAVAVVEHIYREHGDGHRDPLRARTCSSARSSRSAPASRCACGTASATSTPGSARATSPRCAPQHPGADFLIHPECGCSTSVMEYVAAGDVDPRGRAHALDRRDARSTRRRAQPGGTAIVATEVGMLHGLQMAAPDVDFIAANEAASCRYMKMITLPKLRDALRDGEPEVQACRRRSRSGRAPRSSAWSRSASARRSSTAVSTGLGPERSTVASWMSMPCLSTLVPHSWPALKSASNCRSKAASSKLASSPGSSSACAASASESSRLVALVALADSRRLSEASHPVRYRTMIGLRPARAAARGRARPSRAPP